MPRRFPFVDLNFPRGGIDRSRAYAKQPVRNANGEYVKTTTTGQNVRAYEPLTDRARGGTRPGLSKFAPLQPSGANIIQELNIIVGSGYSLPGGGTVQQSNSGRVVTLVAVVQGNIFTLDAGDTAWNSPTNNTGSTPPLNFTGVMQSAANQQKLYFADGVNRVFYRPSDDTINTWTLTAGTYPVDILNNTPRLICTWRGRTVLAGLPKDPHNWFMSRVDDPLDYDYAPASPSAKQAVAGNNASLGLIGDVVTNMIPYTDDVLIFGCDHEIWQMTGDPMAGGNLDMITKSIGMAWGQAWCMDPYGNIYFFGNRPAIYQMTPGSVPNRISKPIENLLQDINTGENTIRMMWNDRAQGMHVFVSPTTEPGDVGEVTHFFFEQRTGAWWTDQFLDPDMDPLCCVTFDGNQADDRVPLIGSWDGYVRAIDHDMDTDDGEDIESEVILGPFLTPDLDDVMIHELQAVLGEASGEVTFSVLIGDTAEGALASTAVRMGTWDGGRNLTTLIRRAAHALYVKISSSNRWAMEQVRAKVTTRGRVRMRGA